MLPCLVCGNGLRLLFVFLLGCVTLMSEFEIVLIWLAFFFLSSFLLFPSLK
jgi:hypothetical protein